MPSARRERLNALTYVAGLVFQRVSMLLVLPILLRRFSAAEYGAFGLLQSLQNLLPAILTANLPATVTRLYFDGATDEDRQGIVAKLTTATLATGVVLGAVCLALANGQRARVGAFLAIPDSAAIQALVLVFLGALGSALLQVAYGIWRAERRAAWAAGSNVANGMLFLVLAFTVATTNHLTVVSVFACYAIATLVVGGGGSLLAPKWRFARRGPEVKRLYAEAVHYGLPALPYILGLWVFGAGGRWIGRFNLDLAAIGHFTLGSQLAMMLSLLGRSAYEAWTPNAFALIAAGKHEEARTYLRRQGNRTVAIVAALGVVGALGLAVVLPRFAPAYAPVARIFPLMLLAPIFEISYLRPHTELLGLKRTRPIGLYTGITVAVFLVAGTLATRVAGLWGLAAAYVLPFGLQLIGATIAVRWARRDVAAPVAGAEQPAAA